MFGEVTASWGMRFNSDCHIRRGNVRMYMYIVEKHVYTHMLSVHCCSHIPPYKYSAEEGSKGL